MTQTVRGYTELRELGSGATGTVWAARHDISGQIVAIKHLSPALLRDPEARARFRAEAAVLASLRHPNIVRLYHFVEGDDGVAMVLELVDGVSLRHAVGRSDTSPESALTVLRGALDALESAHARGIVHRDVKPDNAILAGDGVSRLVDFGLARNQGEPGAPAGSPSYAPPEQWAGAPSSPRGDVYAAGATLFELLTGHVPFPGDDLARLRLQHERAPVPVAELPPAVRGLVQRAMAKSESERFESAAAFLAELEDAAARGYGQTWQERGTVTLVGVAGSLAALAPLALLGHAAAAAAAPAVTTVTQTALTHSAVQGTGHAAQAAVGGTLSPATAPASAATASAHGASAAHAGGPTAASAAPHAAGAAAAHATARARRRPPVRRPIAIAGAAAATVAIAGAAGGLALTHRGGGTSPSQRPVAAGGGTATPGASASPSAAGPAGQSLLPLAAGTTWTYSETDTVTGLPPITQTRSVTVTSSTPTADGGSDVLLTSEIARPTSRSHEEAHILEGADGSLSVGGVVVTSTDSRGRTTTVTWTGTNCVQCTLIFAMPNDAPVGQDVHIAMDFTGTFSGGLAPIHGVGTMVETRVGDDAISVAGHQVQATKFHVVLPPGLNGGCNEELDEWFVPDVGLVRETSTCGGTSSDITLTASSLLP